MKNGFKQVANDYKIERAKRVEAAKADVLAFTRQLKKAGVSAVTVEFSGHGDDGIVNDPVFTNKHGQVIQCDITVEALGALLPPGWEINEGSEGTITFDVATGEIAVAVGWNVSSTEREEYKI